MRRKVILKFIFIVLFMVVSGPEQVVALSIKNVLPEKSLTEGWIIDGKVSLFDKDNLFDHIDGEAELYFPYGFEALASAVYTNKKNPDLSIVIDVYKMASPLDAFGIYSNYRTANSSWVKIGAEGFISSSQLMFYQGRYFVRLQASGTTNLPGAIFQSCARAISANLPAGHSPPEELEIMKIKELVPKSERYIAQSLLGYDFFHRGIIADAVVQNEKMQVFAIHEKSPAAARKTFSQYCSYLQAEGRKPAMTENKTYSQVVAVDPLYGQVLVQHSGRYVLGAVRAKNVSIARQLIDELRKRVNAELQ